MIQDNYYEEFVKTCKRNKKVLSIPTKQELEDNECNISSLCYLIDKDGHEYNMAFADPGLLSKSTGGMFIQDSLSSPTFTGTFTKPNLKSKSKSKSKKNIIIPFVSKGNIIDHVVDDINKYKKPDHGKKEVNPISGKFDNSIEKYIRLSVVREYIKKAYDLGAQEALENIAIEEPDFEELLERTCKE